jgi:4'-phosphopantetheinyl transferase EntD
VIFEEGARKAREKAEFLNGRNLARYVLFCAISSA